MKRSVDQLRIITIPPPADLPEPTQEIPADPGDPCVDPSIPPTPLIPTTQRLTKTEERIWQKEVDEYMKRRYMLDRNLENLYSLIWGQCDSATALYRRN